ncbi:hypothetical protein IFM89_020089 [Coptis chinensis]|uniref:Uncharacterized protein n=1 Tax=Coptis chinensis TaxID=261450 RepID=A0A835LJX8_9MAGN|nr:hypothetical protein IFM89_020089 [Coptis chinensis]
MDKNYRVWVLHGENPCTDPVVEPVIEEENTEAKGLVMGNFVDVSYGVHEVVAGDLNKDGENHMGDFKPPPVLEPDLGNRKRINLRLVQPLQLSSKSLWSGKTDGDAIIVMDAFALLVEGTETRANAQADAYEY